MVNRRQSLRRLLILPPVLVSLGDSQDEVMFDLSEGGLSVYGRVSPQEKHFKVSFRLPGEPSPITSRGEIAWASKARNRTGVRFVGLADQSRSRLREWMSTKLPPAAPYASDYEIDRGSFVSQFLSAVREGAERSKPLAKAALAIAVVAGILFFGLQMSHSHANSLPPLQKNQPASPDTAQNAPPTPAPHETEHNTPAPPAHTAAPIQQRAADPPQTVSSPRSEPLARSGTLIPTRAANTPHGHTFVLQVGAMKEAHNADSLANSIREKVFPVIVSKSNGDGLYRVVVGPYPDMLSAIRMKSKLEEEGFSSFVRQW